MSTRTDRIQKTVVLRAGLARVWRAVSDAQEFGSWFGVEFDDAFIVGQRIIGKIRPTRVDAEVAKMQEPHAGAAFECSIERIEPMRLFSFRWHPFAVEEGVDYSQEIGTLVEFELEELAEGTRLTITESGFDLVPIERRAKAFTANEEGWTIQVRLIEQHLAAGARG